MHTASPIPAPTRDGSRPDRALTRLQQQYREICLGLDQRPPQHPAAAAATFIPAEGPGLAFDSPFVPVGSVTLCVLEPPVIQPGGEPGSAPTFRCLTPRFDPQTGRTDWIATPADTFPLTPGNPAPGSPAPGSPDPGSPARSDHSVGFASDHDRDLRRDPRRLDTLIGLHTRLGRDANLPTPPGRELKLPPTYLGFDPAEGRALERRLIARPTPRVTRHAERLALSIPQAWRDLDARTRPDPDLETTGLRLVDARLCPPAPGSPDPGSPPAPGSTPGDVPLPGAGLLGGTSGGSRGVFHDLRRLLGRHYRNPARKVATLRCVNPARAVTAELNRRHGEPGKDPGDWSQAEADEAITLMRQAIGPRHVFLDEFDLAAAIVNPGEPVHVQSPDLARVRAEHDPAAIAQGLRGLLMPMIADGCTDADLLTAIDQPGAPLIASRIVRPQIYHPPPPEALGDSIPLHP